MVDPAILYVLAGTNGAGKSSIGGAFYRSLGREYFNPDEVARELRTQNPQLTAEQANSEAWFLNARSLGDAIKSGRSYAFETTLGGRTITSLLQEGVRTGHQLHLWYVGLDTPERHLARIAARVRRGGHDIPEQKVRERYRSSLLNLIALIPQAHRLELFDNSAEADASGKPAPTIVLRAQGGTIDHPKTHAALGATPDWAKPAVVCAFEHFTLAQDAKKPRNK